MDIDSVDVGYELTVRVELLFTAPPAVFISPICDEIFHFVKRNPLRPVVDHFPDRPAHNVYLLMKVLYHLIRNGNGKRPYRGVDVNHLFVAPFFL